jgi:DNA-binding NarL/FixJ family response regulator
MVVERSASLPPGRLKLRRTAKPKRKYRILVADRGGVFRLGLKKLFALEDDFRVVAQAENAGQATELARRFRADLLFIQYEITREGTGDLVSRLRHAVPSGRIVIVGDGLREEEIRHLVKQGAAGVVLRSADPDSFLRCAVKVSKNENFLPDSGTADSVSSQPSASELRPVETLTRREKSIMGCLLQGWRNREIAQHLSITEQTVKNHLRTIFDKVGVSDRLELVLYAIHHRMELPPPAPSSGG